MKDTVLIVDDSATVRKEVSTAVLGAGFQTHEAEDGVQGLDAINSNHRIGVVICDINMPNMNGLTMLEKVRENPAHEGLPVIMLTTEGDPNLIKRAKAAGAKGWMIKPFKEPAIIAAISNILKP